MRRLLRLGAALVAATMLGGALVACDNLGYDKDWPASDVLLVVQHKDGLILVGIDPVTGAAHPFAPVPDVHVKSNAVPEAAVLHTGSGVFLAATDGGDPGVLVRVDLAGHRLTKVADLPSARLPIVDGRALDTVGGGGDGFQARSVALDDPGSAQSHPLRLTPIGSDGHCLTGTMGPAETVHIGLVHGSADLGAPKDLGPGVPGGVACARDLALVTVSSLNAAGQQPPPGTTLLVVRGGDVARVAVNSQPHQVAVDEAGSVAAVAVSSANGPAVQRVDLGTGRVVSTTDLPGGVQVETMAIHGGNLFVIGGDQGVVLPAGGGDRTTTINLPGPNVTSVWD